MESTPAVYNPPPDFSHVVLLREEAWFLVRVRQREESQGERGRVSRLCSGILSCYTSYAGTGNTCQLSGLLSTCYSMRISNIARRFQAEK